MNEVKRVDGWTTSDNQIFKTEDEANNHQKYINIRNAICDILEDHMSMNDRYARLAAHLIAENKNVMYNILKDNL